MREIISIKQSDCSNIDGSNADLYHCVPVMVDVHKSAYEFMIRPTGSENISMKVAGFEANGATNEPRRLPRDLLPENKNANHNGEFMFILWFCYRNIFHVLLSQAT